MINIATIKDVAKYAGLSVSTVSRYLNDHPYISEDKKEKIKAAMDALDYAPSTVATQLRSNKINSIGVIISNITNPYYAYLTDAIEKEARLNNYQIIIMQTNDDKEIELHHLNRLKERMVSGLILCSLENELSVLESYQKYGPIILCNDSVESESLSIIKKNQKEATYEAITYLINQGCKRIAYCTGGQFDNGHGKLRNEGFIEATNDHHIPIDDSLIYRNIHTINDGRNIAKDILSRAKDTWPDAIFTGSDEVAAGLQNELLKAKVNIPRDIKIMGFDNQPISELLPIPLTTIQQPINEIGTIAANWLVHLIKGEQYEFDPTEIKLKLIIRESA